jgi:hypothetical protein
VSGNIARRVLLLVFLVTAPVRAQGDLPTTPERTAFVETSRYAEVMAFVTAIADASDAITVDTFGYSFEGRALPVVRWGRGPTKVLVFANIHAGEVEGKEAAQVLLRDLAMGAHAAWGDSLIVLVAPIYNADGNERVALTNRPRQLGPVGGMGQRPNAMGLDLNRDFMKLESPEARSLVGLIRDHDPHVVIDLHTTNGTLHGYHLTYSPPLHPDTNPAIDGFLRDSLFPAVTAALRERPGEAPACGGEGGVATTDGCERLAELRKTRTWDTYNYGNLPEDEGFEAERGWYTFDHRPRYSNNYAGLRNRLGILSETYAYVPFDERIVVTLRFVEEILQFAYAHATAIRRLTEGADTEELVGKELAVRAEIARTADRVEILLGDVEEVRHPYTGETTLRRLDVQRRETMPEYGRFRATETAAVPRAYLVPAGFGDALAILAAHGVEFHTLAESATLAAQEFRITASAVAEEEFQQHRERTLGGAWSDAEERTFPAGTVVVPMDQPLARLALLLLDPRSDDGLANWNVLDAALEGAEVYPILRTQSSLQTGAE